MGKSRRAARGWTGGDGGGREEGGRRNNREAMEKAEEDRRKDVEDSRRQNESICTDTRTLSMRGASLCAYTYIRTYISGQPNLNSE